MSGFFLRHSRSRHSSQTITTASLGWLASVLGAWTEVEVLVWSGDNSRGGRGFGGDDEDDNILPVGSCFIPKAPDRQRR